MLSHDVARKNLALIHSGLTQPVAPIHCLTCIYTSDSYLPTICYKDYSLRYITFLLKYGILVKRSSNSPEDLQEEMLKIGYSI